MPEVHILPVQQPMSNEEVVARIQAGWRILGQQVVQTDAPGIVTPNNPQAAPGLVLANVWFLPEPVIPMTYAAKMVAELATKYAISSLSLAVINDVSLFLLGEEAKDIQRKVREFEGQQAPEVPEVPVVA